MNHILTIFFILGLSVIQIRHVQSDPASSSKLDRGTGCNRGELHRVAHAYANSINLRFVLRKVNCDKDWAVLAGDLEYLHAPSDGPQGVGTTLIFRREGSL
jgi:hypothetical protein